ncbi:glycoside hydrolase family 78 protein [candidate division KSB1 bacterium]|nr:glycoside hydrolase family 78 protein [candidate division KSB1 bacterium]
MGVKQAILQSNLSLDGVGFICLMCFSLATVLAAKSNPAITLTNLRVEYQKNPLGIDVRQPRFSWEMAAAKRGVWQTGYQLRCAATPEHLKAGKNLLWDTGKVASVQSIQIEYAGPALQSGQRVYWQARCWDENNQPTPWSEAAFWEMGLLQPTDWRGEWIEPQLTEDSTKSQPCPYLRHEFALTKAVKSARAYVTSHGLYELYLNGQRVGDYVFTPGWTSYQRRLLYQTYDVTPLLHRGPNAVGAILGDGWYRGSIGWNQQRNYYGEKLALLVQIQVQYTDGTVEIIGADATWKTSTGPILESDIYNGEIYDARLEMPGWNRTGFSDQNWQPVQLAAHSKTILAAPNGPPVRKIQELTPVKIFAAPNGQTVFDLGQNMVGWVRLQVQGAAGTVVTLTHGEVLDQAGNLYLGNLRSAKQRVQYILKGGAPEVFEPHFTFQGFRYVAVEGFPGEPTPAALTGIVIHSDMTPVGEFTCSDSMLNQLQHNIQWGQKGNFLDVPTDCPQRDERMGWTGDAQVFSETACFNMDAAGFYTKWLQDLAADQFPDGSVPFVVPDVLKGGGSAAWADAAVIVPWTVYLCYGDQRILEQQYPSMQAWVGYMQNQAGESYLWNKGHHFGDWLAFATNRSDYPGATTDKDLIATAYFAHSTHILQKIAVVLNKKEDAQQYADLFEKVKAAFQQEFVSPNGRLTSNTQTAYSLALGFELLPEALKACSAERLAQDVQYFKHITTGFVGANLVNPVLTDYGYLDLAYLLLNRKEYPSWLYPITKGATTIWERWDGIKPDGSFQDQGMNSFNHYAYGAIGNWLYRVVAGIQIDPSQPGYKHFRIQPQPGGGLTAASARHHSMYGEIASAWKLEKGQFTLTVTIPPNTRATVLLPAAQVAAVVEGGKALQETRGVINYAQEKDGVRVEVGAGTYQFGYPVQP